jgi:DHA1 family tetracycline resistance protein-like MFS transporter
MIHEKGRLRSAFFYFYRMQKRLIPAYLLTLVNVLGFSILMPILPFVVKNYGAPEWVYGLLLTCYSAFQFIGAPFLGALSDQQGRKPILLVSQAGTLLSWFVFVLALSLPDYPIFGLALPLWIIAFSRILDGVTGGNASVTNAYVSDITTREEKSYIFGYLGGIAGIGMIIGPGLGGLTASTSLGFYGTMIVAIVISSITLLTISLWLKESHPEEKRTVRKKTPIWHMIFIPARVKAVNPSSMIKVIFTVKMFFATMMAFYISTIALYLIDMFSFEEKELGFFLFIVGLFLAFNQAFLSKRFIKKFGEYNTLLIGLTLCVIGLFSITMTSNLYLFIAFYYTMNLGLSLCFPTFNALISIHADHKNQGEIMGISESINSFAMAVFPVIGAALFGIIGLHLYQFMMLLPFTALVLALIGGKRMNKPSHTDNQ